MGRYEVMHCSVVARELHGMDRWTGRVAIVTGASSGVGAAIVRELVTNGLVVVGLSRRDTRMQEICEDLKDCSGQLHPVKADVTREEDIQAAFRWTERRLGGVDILVNSAGMSMRSDIIGCKLQEWKKMFDLNVFTLAACSREAIKSMRCRRVHDGHIINIDSVIAHKAKLSLGNHVFSASKQASKVIIGGLRHELKQAHSKIKITNVTTGLVGTEVPAVAGWREQMYSSYSSVQPQDVANAVTYILSIPSSVQVNEILVRSISEGL